MGILRISNHGSQNVNFIDCQNYFYAVNYLYLLQSSLLPFLASRNEIMRKYGISLFDSRSKKPGGIYI